jgi:hypothetical protein
MREAAPPGWESGPLGYGRPQRPLPLRLHALLVGGAGQTGAAREGGARVPEAPAEFSFGLTYLQADGSARADGPGAAGACVLAWRPADATRILFADTVIAVTPDTAGAVAAVADTGLPQLAARNAGSVAIGIARQAKIVAAFEVESPHFTTTCSLRATADLITVAVTTATLVIACTVSGVSKDSGEVLDAAGGAVCSTAFGIVAAARTPSKRNLLTGLADLMAANATGAGATAWATARRPRRTRFPRLTADIGPAQAATALKTRTAVIVRFALEVLALAAAAVVARPALAAVVVLSTRPALGPAAVRGIEVKGFATECRTTRLAALIVAFALRLQGKAAHAETVWTGP